MVSVSKISPGGDRQVPELLENPAGLRDLLLGSRRIAVVGASNDEGRASHWIMAYLLEAGYDVIPVNPRYEKILGRPCRASLEAIEGPVDIVNVFRRPEEVGPIVDQAIARGDSAVWLQDGVIAPEAAERALSAGLTVVMNRCIYRDHARWVGAQ
ncbi:MAG: CoA-binding protein [Planctomycetota bacterium]